MKPSDSESDSEQFVCIDQKEKEAKISADKKNEVFDIKNKPSLLSDSDEKGGENSDVEGPSSLKASDIENDEPKHLEEDMFDILDKQIAEDFSKKSVENDAKAKEDVAKKTEKKLQNLAKKQAEYAKQGPTKNGVCRLENYLNNFIIDSEPAKIEELPKPSELNKSKSRVKVKQKPIIKQVEKPNSPTSKENVSKVVEAKKEESKPTAKVETVKPKEAPKPSKVSETKKNSEKPKSHIGKYDPTIPVIGDVFLDENVKPGAQNEVKMIEENFLEQVKTDAPTLDDENFLNEVTENSSNKAVPLLGDELLGLIDGNKSGVKKYENAKPVSQKVIQMNEEDFLNRVGKVSSKRSDPFKIVDDFLDQVSDCKSAAKKAPVMASESSSTKPSLIVPGQKLFKPMISHRPSNANFFEDTTITKLINAADIGVNYDSDSFDSSTPELSTQVFTFLEYKLDQYLNVPNYAVVHEMKDRIAKSIPPPRVNHLLNFWLENNFPFSDLVVLFQYLYYHVERLGCVDSLSFKTYEHLVDAVVRREHIFHSRHEHVSNIPLMCRFKFLIFDDNYPEYILINPELLKLQMYPLIGGFPTAVMYLFKDKRKWLISELKEEFSDCYKAEFYRQLCNFLNDRPDLVMLQSPRPQATFPEMYIVLNDHISLKFCCYMFTLKDLNVAEKLHL